MREREKIIFLLGAVFVALIVGILAVRADQTQNAKGSTAQDKIKEIKIPTTRKDKQHSKLLAQSKGRRISELTAKGTGDITLVVSEPLVMMLPGKESQPASFIQAKVCNAGAVVIGTLNNSSPQLTDDESFLFTESAMTVEEVIKNNPNAPIQPEGTISVVRDGGVGKFQGRTIRAKVEGFEPFIDGRRYILFLRFIPDTGSYLAYANGSFQLSDGTIIPLGKLPDNISREATTFLNATRASAAAINDCAKQQDAK
jgi:hypothetical protein